MKGALAGKYAGIFVSTASPGGGQEATAMNTLSTLTHHGIIFVPLGYSHTFGQLTNLSEVHGGESPSPLFTKPQPTRNLLGSPWGAGTFAGGDGSRQPTPLELEIATIQGTEFFTIVKKAFPSAA